MDKYIISTGRSRHDIRWKQKKVTWEQIVEKLRNTHYTAETVAEYAAAPKDRKGEIKDIGGFVGGPVEGGRRKKGSVKQRYLLTLDIDYAEGDIWEDIEMLYECASVIYSTHSHTPASPRYRLVMPLSRPVDRDEYEAVARKVASNIGIDQFDDSTYQSERLMYWPSTSKNGEYYFRESSGGPLDVDAELATYTDWRDASQWEVSSRQMDIVRRAMKKQGDPLEKPGLIGLFCRTYSIQDAIEIFLADVYAPVANMDDRYTYLQGSSAAGLVVYDNKFAYSHHGTDPCGGQLCNAFDLVRTHLYGMQDEEMRPDTPINRRPSYMEMEKMVRQDPGVKKMLGRETLIKASEDFSHVNPDDLDEQDWLEKMETKKDGGYYSSAKNILLILNNAPGLKNNIRRDLMSRAEVIVEDLPWRPLAKEDVASRFWSNIDDAQLLVHFELVYDITGKEKILNAKTKVAADNAYHPVIDYLNKLQWDGRPRVNNLFIDYLDATDDELTRQVTRKSIVAAVARVFEPGCKYDYITVLQGPEGIGKSTLLAKLGGEWFNDSITDLAGSKGIEQIQGFWIAELGELQGIKRNEVEATKAFVSRQVDTFRPAYGRVKETLPRQCVFFATTNESEFLKGDNGNRRFWIIPCGNNSTKDVWEIDDYERDQIWAEALELYKAGEQLYLDYKYECEMRVRQQDYNEGNNDARAGVIENFLETKLPTDWASYDTNQRIVYLADDDSIEKHGIKVRDKVCAAEILQEVLKERMDDTTKYKIREINNFLQKMPGWRKMAHPERFGHYGVQRGYERIKDDAEEESNQ